ncbi:hypothetical protein [Limosilactobacillus ingluviei]|uniref:hypothetical protein n=1 Tax=Limosilactobacillus ingluviei TaxID=148604 RepID=UPI0023EF6E33|nr:hypothetical protein [Limosilactobacillus ingluviei]
MNDEDKTAKWFNSGLELVVVRKNATTTPMHIKRYEPRALMPTEKFWKELETKNNSTISITLDWGD